jgi:hypothetical protein
MTEGIHFAKSSPSNDSSDTYKDTQTVWEGFVKHAVEMGISAMMYIPTFIKTGSGIQKLICRNSQTYRHTDSMQIT